MRDTQEVPHERYHARVNMTHVTGNAQVAKRQYAGGKRGVVVT